MLKAVLDALVNVAVGVWDYTDVVKVCRALYGQDERANREVLDYYVSTNLVQEALIAKHEQKELDWLDAYSKYRLSQKEVQVNTGFHVYHPAGGTWKRVSPAS